MMAGPSDRSSRPSRSARMLRRTASPATSSLVWPVSLPVHVDDPLERVRLIAKATALAKKDQELRVRRSTDASWSTCLQRSHLGFSVGKHNELTTVA